MNEDNKNRDRRDGTIGFPQISGHGKAGRSNTSSFDVNTRTQTPIEQQGEQAGQEEGGRMRQPSTSAVGRIL